MNVPKAGIAFAGLVLFAVPALSAEDPASYDKDLLLSLDSTSCGFAERDGKTITGEILGTDSAHKNTQEVLCQEYVLQSDHIVFRIRPRDLKHPILLPVGEMVEFRIHKDVMVLRDPERDKKDHEYTVVSMLPRENVREARNSQ